MPYTTKTFSQTMDDLRATFDRWGVSDWRVAPARGSRRQRQSREEARVTVLWSLRGQVVTVTLDEYDTDAENLRAIYNSIEALRLIEHRGVTALMREIFAQLPRPASSPALPMPAPAATDPYAIIGVTAAMSLDEIEAIYRVRARKAHPDAGGSVEAMAALNAAIERIRKEKERA